MTDNLPPLDSILHLMLRSEYHKHYSIQAFERVVIPPLGLKQYIVWHTEEDMPVGYASWAFLTDEASAGYISRTRKLQPEDWNAGENPWFINFIAPYGGVLPMVRSIYNALPGLQGARVRRIKDGKVRIGRYGRFDAVDAKIPVSEWAGETVPGLH